MKKIIDFVLKQLKIVNFGDLYRRWEDALDWFFYFNKATGCGVPSIEEVRRFLYGKSFTTNC